MSVQHIIAIILSTILVSEPASSATADQQQEILVDSIIACVDDQIILQSELEKKLQQYQVLGGALEPSLKHQVLADMLVRKMLLAKANAEGLSVEKSFIEDSYSHKMQELITQLGSEATIEQRLGKPMQAIKKEMKAAIEEQLLAEQMHKKIIGNLSVTPKEVKIFFDELPIDKMPYYPAEVELRQIVRYPILNQQEQVAIIEQLQALKARAQAGEKFEQLAKQYSEDSDTAIRGGELGFRQLGELATAYETAVLALKPGEISDPIETPFGFHLIQLIAKKGDYYNTRHILIKPSSSTARLQEVSAYLDSIRTSILAGHMTFEEAAQQYSQDMATACQGGILTDAHGAERIAIDDLPSEVFLAIDKLTPGAITEPITVRVATGKQAVRILYLKDKLPPHAPNLQQDYDKIAQMALAAKKRTVLEEWVKDTQAEVFIKIDPAYQGCTILK